MSFRRQEINRPGSININIVIVFFYISVFVCSLNYKTLYLSPWKHRKSWLHFFSKRHCMLSGSVNMKHFSASE